MGNDADLMPWISSANIACGAHAGDEQIMKRTVELALEHNVAIGAHPGFEDKANFGRTEMHLDNQAVFDLITKQVYTLKTVAREQGAAVVHVKPHGALYNMAARDEKLAEKICEAIIAVDPSLILYGLSGSAMIGTAKRQTIKTCNEVFADRTYQDDGSLTPRSKDGALITDDDKALKQVLQMIKEKKVRSLSGKEISLVAETICIHGDSAHALDFARKINTALKEQHINIIHPSNILF